MAPRPRPLQDLLVTSGVLALTALIFCLDLLTPRGVALGAAYVCPILVAFASTRRTLPLEVAIVTSGLTVVDYFLSAGYVGAPWVAVVNRALSVIMIWFVALLSLERRRIGAALRRSEARSAAALETAMDGMLLVGGGGRVRWANGVAMGIFGLRDGDLGRPIPTLLPDWPEGRAPDLGVRESQGRRGDGATFPARLAVSRVALDDDEELFLAIVHDTSQMRAREQALGVMLSHLPLEVLRVGPTGEVLERHGDALTRVGLEPSALLAGLEAELGRARRGEPVDLVREVSGEGRGPSLEHWLVPDVVHPGGVLWFCLDVTERRREERKIEVATKLAALGELAGNIAHEINNPVGIISAKARLLASGAEPLSERARQELGKIAAQCDRVAGLTRKLLDYVRPAPDRRERLDLRDPARKALGLVTVKAQRQGVAVADDLDAPLPAVCNPDELEQVFLNLFINAVDAMPQGGTLRVSGGARGGAPFVRVADSGTGMDASTQRRLFEPFFTTKADRGTGLGLHICHRIVEGHGGDIDVESAPGAGTTFTVTLPRPAGEPRAPELVGAPAEAARGGLSGPVR